ncbi:MAG: hypothetical protein M1825_000129 [Sarcosagium campestre]|nr:MAG: hypothetical protein M1825_000129 [Sarcosagium campestre]
MGDSGIVNDPHRIASDDPFHLSSDEPLNQSRVRARQPGSFLDRGSRGGLQQRNNKDSSQGNRGSRNRVKAHGPGNRSHAGIDNSSSRVLASSSGLSAARPDDGQQTENLARLKINGDSNSAGDAETDDGNEVCFICASTVEHYAVSPCNHRTCHICALRLRALYKTKACAHCRSVTDFVIFTDHATKRYQEYSTIDFASSDDHLGIRYENQEIRDDTILLLRYNCPDPTCDMACRGWPDLKRHVKAVHKKTMCNICIQSKIIFTHEHELFNFADLVKHERLGDKNSGAVDQNGFRGHPECGFCHKRFYGADELYQHCRDQHERCHICDARAENGSQVQYYQDYNALEVHFRQGHFLCFDRECLEKKFVVFGSEMDLKAHQLEVHPNDLSKDARRDARRIDMSNFDYRTEYQPTIRTRPAGGRGRGRGQDPNIEAIPHSTAQALRRDELAYRRQVAIQETSASGSRSLGGQSTNNEAARQGRESSSSATTPRRIPAASDRPLVEHDEPQATRSSEAATPQPERLLQNETHQRQHAAVMDRAAALLGTNSLKAVDFRTKVSMYQRSQLSAQELIDSFFLLFDTSTAALGKLIRELADIYEDETKRRELLKAWNDWCAINEDYPSLPGPSGILPGAHPASLGNGGKRVLRLKNSTAQPRQTAANKQAGWRTADAGDRLVPAIGTSSSSSTNREGTTTTSQSTYWPGANFNTRPAPSSPRPPTSSTSSSGTRPVIAASADAFPALPAAAKPTTTIFGYGTGAVRRDAGRSANTSAWGQNGFASNADSSEGASESDQHSSGAKRKGKAAKKQTLYHFG